MFDLKKTIVLSLLVLSTVSVAIAGYMVGHKVGFAEGKDASMANEHSLVVKQDSLLRRQTETCHKLMDAFYERYRDND